MKDYVILGLVLVIMIIIIQKHQSSFSSADITAALPFTASVGISLKNDCLDIIINQTKGLPVLASVNSVIGKINSDKPSAQLVPYTSETQLTHMFQTAYDSGESSLTKTDKTILRIMLLSGIGIDELPWGTGGLPAISFTDQGKPVWADEVIGQTGLTIQEGITKAMEMFREFATLNEAAIIRINSVLPSNLTPFANAADYHTRVPSFTDPTVVWFIKFASIGPLYMNWLAQNKWKIDASWRLV